MERQEQANAKPKQQWTKPSTTRVDARSAELGLGVGADLIIIGTSS
jgi:hypothetical protein